uniref:Uncharacterized protein n=1 Tax=Vitrella brassicaformis TaxID=1169539 RepID=A0A7S1PED3_9ALVE|mmetsp:Transcript_53177/g.133873  ORF Transcript_53177/g.133873 Transcript_53177/m.133873 type:complete len:308 (+) Transcript_53177:136-1059(+)
MLWILTPFLFSLSLSRAALVRRSSAFIPPHLWCMTPASRGALTRTIAKESDGRMPSPQPKEQPIPSDPDGVPAGTPTKCGGLEVYGRSDEEVRQGLDPLPRVTLPPELVERHKFTLFPETGRWTTGSLKDINLLTVVFYVWPLLEQMIFRTNCADQDNDDDISMSFMVGKDGRTPRTSPYDYQRQIWVLVGDDEEYYEGTKASEQALKRRLARQALRYGCYVDDALLKWTFYSYNDKTFTLEEIREFDHRSRMSQEGQPQEIVDFMAELLHKNDTSLSFPTWEGIRHEEQKRKRALLDEAREMYGDD